MIRKVTERSSAFVVVSRKTLLSGMAGIAVVSFGLGYFLAYGGPTSDKIVKHVEADNKIAPSEEKTVLDSSGKPTVVMPPTTPDAIPKEPVPRTPEQPKADQTKVAPKPADIQNKPVATPAAVPSTAQTATPAAANPAQKIPDTRGSGKADSQTAQEPVKPAPKPQSQMAQQSAPRPVPEKQASVAAREEKKDADQPKIEIEEKAKEKSRIKAGKKSRSRVSEKKHPSRLYALQVGAFVDVRKARRLKDDLDAKGYKTYIMTYSSEKGKKFSRVRIGPYETKEQASEIIQELKDNGLEGVIVPGHR
jgi:DedD protein